MNPKKIFSKRNLLVVLVFVSVFTFATTAIKAFVYHPEDEIDLGESIAEKDFPHLLPKKLIIPSLSIEANVQQVGINRAGNMATPSGFSDVGWYKYGTLPGQKGSAVITGHLDNALDLDGVFKNLKNLKAGDEIMIVDEAQKILTFSVTGVQYYPFDNTPSEVIFNRSDTERLNLITCAGIWLKDKGSYSERLVVYTKLKK